MTDPVKEMEDTEISEKPGDKTEQIDDDGIKADGTEEKDLSAKNKQEHLEELRRKIAEAEKKYRRILDARELSSEFSELSALCTTEGLDDSELYESLRDDGLSARDAFLASNSDMLWKSPSKAHITPVLTTRQETPLSMNSEEYAAVKAIFGDSMSDERIAELYRRVKKH